MTFDETVRDILNDVRKCMVECECEGCKYGNMEHCDSALFRNLERLLQADGKQGERKPERRNIFIILANDAEREWRWDEYDDYTVNGDLFIVRRGQAWVGIYPLGQIRSIDIVEGE